MAGKFKPMLADAVILERVRYPVAVSPKLDGVRATFAGGLTPVSRSLKPFPNKAINSTFVSSVPFDGEFIVGDAHSPTVFRDTMKVVMSFDAPIDNLRMCVFDLVDLGTHQERFARVCQLVDYKRIIPVPHTIVKNQEELLGYEDTMLKVGYEGIMLRDPNGLYKNGRSTVTEGGLLKLKRKLTAEARVVGFEEQMHNANEATTDALGHTERSSHQANKHPMGTLGALVVQDIKTGIEFNVGTGFSAEERQDIWNKRDSYDKKVLTYEYLPIGVKDKPRHPVFKGWRDERDMS